MIRYPKFYSISLAYSEIWIFDWTQVSRIFCIFQIVTIYRSWALNQNNSCKCSNLLYFSQVFILLTVGGTEKLKLLWIIQKWSKKCSHKNWYLFFSPIVHYWKNSHFWNTYRCISHSRSYTFTYYYFNHENVSYPKYPEPKRRLYIRSSRQPSKRQFYV